MKAKRLLSMILSLVMLASVFVLGTTAAEVSPYKDVNTSRWSYADLMYVTEKGLMNGTTADKFAPAETMTRAMVVTVLYRLQGEPETQYKATFTDVKNNKWFTDAVIWAAENKIVEGKGNGIFAPTETITREQLATIIMRYAPMEYIITEERADITHYADYKRVHDYAKDALSWANAIGLITGKTADTLAPREGATREQFAKILRCFKEYDSYKYELVYNTPKPLSTYTGKPYELVTDADIYVAVDGNDTNPGTLDKPVATFAKAKEMVRELKKTAKDEIVVAFKAGDYGVLDNLQFTAEDSGSESVPVTYCAYGDGEVYFTNGIYIAEDEFKPLNDVDKAFFAEANYDKIKKVDISGLMMANNLDTVTGLFSETDFCYPARTPNKSTSGADNYYVGFTDYVATPDSPYTMEEIKEEASTNGYLNADTIIIPYTEQKKLQALFILKKKLDSYDSYDGVQLCGYVSKVWHQDYLDIKSYDKTTGVMEFYNETQYGFINVDEETKAYISNASKELDWSGEFWYNPDLGVLYVFSPEGDYSIATNGRFITMDKASNISFVKLNFRVTTDDAIVANQSDNVTIDRCKISNIAGTQGIYFEKCLDLTVKNSEIYTTAGHAIKVRGVGPGERSDYDYMALENSGLVIDNNLIHDACVTDIHSDAGAIKLTDYVIGAVISHNEVYNATRHAISFGPTNGDVVIEYNYFHHCMTNSADGGVIHNGRDMIRPVNVIRYNIISEIPASLQGGTYGIYLDDYEANNEIYGNIFYGVATAIVTNRGRDNVITDNTLIYSGSMFINPDTSDMMSEWAPGSLYYDQFHSILPKEGSPYYEIWKEKCPFAYEYDIDPENPTSKNSIFLVSSTVKDNIMVDGEFSFSDEVVANGTYENNVTYAETENPFFANPAIGDYSIREGADFADNHFAEIGRY
ncbi:MAG: S-layer homology domain-containing protein [Clostridia bacterium]|nr:S-layer homology domain-containing protein [Clostridia bacterium]